MASSLRAWWRRWLGADSQPRVIGESLRSVAQGDMNKQPLRRKVMIVVLSTTCLALLLSASALLIYELRDYRAMRIADLRAQADIIDRATTSAVVFGDTQGEAENLSMLRLRPQITAAGIFPQRRHPVRHLPQAQCGERGVPDFEPGARATRSPAACWRSTIRSGRTTSPWARSTSARNTTSPGG
ncbi:MAG: CHASE sensor domain-containing protein [Aquabacterium sp.]